jgi:glucose/arabinose dehydrogenase
MIILARAAGSRTCTLFPTVRFRPHFLLVFGAACGDGGDINPVVPGAVGGADGGASTPDATQSDAGGRAPVPDAAPLPPPPAITCFAAAAVTGVWVADPKMCVQQFADGLGAARQMAFSPSGDLFVNNGAVTVLWDGDGDGVASATERSTFATAPSLNHGVAFSRDGAYLYASSSTTVYRWPYASGQRVASGAAEVVVSGMDPSGHNTRTLAFDSQGRLLVTVGSASNVDPPSAWDLRGQIRRYALPSPIPAGGVAYATGEIVARGMRNEVGITVDDQDRIWSVENGRDDLSDPDFGGDIHNDNPGEEINLVDGTGNVFYGYPLCYSEGRALSGGKGPGTQWADQTLDPAIQKTDAWCQSTANVHPPLWAMQAHWAPLGVARYTGSLLPFQGDLIVGSHGSWDRSPAVGRLLARARIQNDVVVAVEPIVGELGDGGVLEGTWDARPVDVRQGPDQAIYFSDDYGGRVFKIGYKSP